MKRAACAALFFFGASAHAQLGAPEIASERVEREAATAKKFMVAAADPRAVDMLTKAAIKEMILPSLLPVLAPIVVYFVINLIGGQAAAFAALGA
ncbi:MAG TPA: sodium/proton-translocating pyrophosphatase, partial [Burkholderiales bacterium]|nr:sodium/proton-translocating pyrophosphatase [Burkholderiales bacterium]